MTKTILRLFLLAILLRILIMPFLFHIDLKSLYFYASFVQEGVTNIYQFMAYNKAVLAYTQFFVYPPPIYFLQGFWLMLANPFLGPNFYYWINDWGIANYTSDSLYRYLFILKVPNLICDLLIGLMLLKMVEAKYKTRVLILWFFNPLTLYINYGLANFDIVPTTLILAALYFYQRNNFTKSGLALGAATAFKIFPFVLWPFFIVSIFKLKGREEALKYILTVLASCFFLNFPWTTDLIDVYNSGLTNRALALKVPFINLDLPIVYIILAALFLLYFFKKNYQPLNLSKYIFAVLLVLLSVTAFHPQWWMWLLPFLVILCAQNLLYLFLFSIIILAGSLQIIGLNDQFITLGILNPIVPNINNSTFLHDLVLRSRKDLILNTAKIILEVTSIILLIAISLKSKLKLPHLPNKYLLSLLILVTITSSAALFGLAVLSSSRKIMAQNYELMQIVIPIYKDHPFIQDIPVKADNVHLVSLNLKNIDFKNSDPFNITLDNYAGQKREFKLSGSNIGVGDWLNLRIDPMNIPEKLGVRLESPTESTKTAILANTDREGNLPYQIYRREPPLNYVKEIIPLFTERLSKDPAFIVFLITLIAILTGALAATYSKKLKV